MTPSNQHTSIWKTIKNLLVASFVTYLVAIAAGFLGVPPIFVYAVFWIGVAWWMITRLRRKSPDVREATPDVREATHEVSIYPLIAPEHAFSEHLMIPVEKKHVTPSSAGLLAEFIDKALITAQVEGCSLNLVAQNSPCTTLALVGLEGSLVVWASIQSEVTRFKITIYYAERNKGRWRGKHETNWNFESSRSEALRVVDTSDHSQDLVFLTVVAATGPKLTTTLAEYANGMRQSFFASISQALDAWQSAPEQNQPSIQEASSAKIVSSGRVRD